MKYLNQWTNKITTHSHRKQRELESHVNIKCWQHIIDILNNAQVIIKQSYHRGYTLQSSGKFRNDSTGSWRTGEGCRLLADRTRLQVIGEHGKVVVGQKKVDGSWWTAQGCWLLMNKIKLQVLV